MSATERAGRNSSSDRSFLEAADRDDVMLWVAEKIRSYVRESPANRLDTGEGPMFGEPLVGFASGADPLFARYKELIGPFHLTPTEALEEAAWRRGAPLPPAEGTGAIAYVLPIAPSTRHENSSMSSAPSRRWAYTRLRGEELNASLQAHLVALLEEQGYIAAAPALGPSSKLPDGTAPLSRWSHRHAAYVAGLGSFGLSGALITAAGTAHRLGSVAVNVPLPSPAKRSGVHDGCLYYRKGTCMACARRCPAGAITASGHDKAACRRHLLSQVPYVRENYHLDIYACGLCQTGVPCECRSPAEEEKS